MLSLNLPARNVSVDFSDHGYYIEEFVGKGQFGRAYKVRYLMDQSIWLAKSIDLGSLDEKDKLLSLQEAGVMQTLKHPCIVDWRESFVHQEMFLVIVMEYCKQGDLASKMDHMRQNDDRFTEKKIIKMISQLAEALHYIHSKNILHRDIKPSNIFLTDNGDLKLGDFGISRVMTTNWSLAFTAVGTPQYMSPEMCENKPYTYKSDLWALGCVAYEITSLRSAFEAESFLALAWAISSQSPPRIPQDYSQGLQELVDILLAKDPSLRPTASSLLALPIIRQHRIEDAAENCQPGFIKMDDFINQRTPKSEEKTQSETSPTPEKCFSPGGRDDEDCDWAGLRAPGVESYSSIAAALQGGGYAVRQRSRLLELRDPSRSKGPTPFRIQQFHIVLGRLNQAIEKKGGEGFLRLFAKHDSESATDNLLKEIVEKSHAGVSDKEIEFVLDRLNLLSGEQRTSLADLKEALQPSNWSKAYKEALERARQKLRFNQDAELTEKDRKLLYDGFSSFDPAGQKRISKVSFRAALHIFFPLLSSNDLNFLFSLVPKAATSEVLYESLLEQDSFFNEQRDSSDPNRISVLRLPISEEVEDETEKPLLKNIMQCMNDDTENISHCISSSIIESHSKQLNKNLKLTPLCDGTSCFTESTGATTREDLYLHSVDHHDGSLMTEDKSKDWDTELLAGLEVGIQNGCWSLNSGENTILPELLMSWTPSLLEEVSGDHPVYEEHTVQRHRVANHRKPIKRPSLPNMSRSSDNKHHYKRRAGGNLFSPPNNKRFCLGPDSFRGSNSSSSSLNEEHPKFKRMASDPTYDQVASDDIPSINFCYRDTEEYSDDCKKRYVEAQAVRPKFSPLRGYNHPLMLQGRNASHGSSGDVFSELPHFASFGSATKPHKQQHNSDERRGFYSSEASTIAPTSICRNYIRTPDNSKSSSTILDLFKSLGAALTGLRLRDGIEDVKESEFYQDDRQALETSMLEALQPPANSPPRPQGYFHSQVFSLDSPNKPEMLNPFGDSAMSIKVLSTEESINSTEENLAEEKTAEWINLSVASSHPAITRPQLHPYKLYMTPVNTLIPNKTDNTIPSSPILGLSPLASTPERSPHANSDNGVEMLKRRHSKACPQYDGHPNSNRLTHRRALEGRVKMATIFNVSLGRSCAFCSDAFALPTNFSIYYSQAERSISCRVVAALYSQKHKISAIGKALSRLLEIRRRCDEIMGSAISTAILSFFAQRNLIGRSASREGPAFTSISRNQSKILYLSVRDGCMLLKLVCGTLSRHRICVDRLTRDCRSGVKDDSPWSSSSSRADDVDSDIDEEILGSWTRRFLLVTEELTRDISRLLHWTMQLVSALRNSPLRAYQRLNQLKELLSCQVAFLAVRHPAEHLKGNWEAARLFMGLVVARKSTAASMGPSVFNIEKSCDHQSELQGSSSSLEQPNTLGELEATLLHKTDPDIISSWNKVASATLSRLQGAAMEHLNQLRLDLQLDFHYENCTCGADWSPVLTCSKLRKSSFSH